MNNCNTCKNAIYDAWWGEYKCSIKQKVIFGGPGKDMPCNDYKKGDPTDAKKNKDYPNKED